MHSLLFVKLNAFEDFGGGAFTFSIFSLYKKNKKSYSALDEKG